MKAIIIIVCIYVVLLPPIIHGADSSRSNDDRLQLSEAEAALDEIIENGETIDNVFKPLQYLGRGYFAVIYKGELAQQSNRTVAMKISPKIMMNIYSTVNEFEMYECMDAVNNSAVEAYGIPAVYYHGEWKNCTMIAITYLDSHVGERIKDPAFTLTKMDILILFREYVRISKYVHGRGVCHKDIKLDNMMFRKHQGFLIDFNLSGKVAESVHDCRKEDWKQFLISVCIECEIETDLIKPGNALLGFENLTHAGLKRVLLVFATYIFQDGLQNYNRMYEIITEEIQRFEEQGPALISWLTDEQKTEAKAEWNKNPTPDIQSIAGPQ